MLDSNGKCQASVGLQFRQADGPCSVSDSTHGQTAQVTTSIRIVAHVGKKCLFVMRRPNGHWDENTQITHNNSCILEVINVATPNGS